ncbi:hypothetical protein CSZ94_16220 [Janthinobacterium sp. ROICE36]|uniref:hypothetical protein n=1 Tax=Janthinobacterium sp. ROICE36 TaxID=2048670 RepID=UPI000C7EE721|nr:hypothetical protein [Janthinobacterium sp. ROICE36]PLY41369.1 hypothetical protein CSZ94_16220 [Janthinobacterium sp. ROICE36]
MDFSIERNGGSGAGQSLPNRRSIVLGIAVSLLLHGALISLWRHVQPPVPQDTAPRVESIAVWIRPLAAKPPPPPVEVVKPKREPKPISKPKLATPRETPAAATPPASGPQAITLTPAAPATPAASPDTFTQETPKFDMEAARKTARKMAGERDPAKVGTAVGQIPDKPLQTETQLARDIAQGKRGDCRSAYAGAGLLAPVLMLLDKKNSGCKW